MRIYSRFVLVRGKIFNIPFFSPIRRLYEPEASIPLFHGLSGGRNNRLE
jgi:hypothetical protein